MMIFATFACFLTNASFVELYRSTPTILSWFFNDIWVKCASLYHRCFCLVGFEKCSNKFLFIHRGRSYLVDKRISV